MPEFESEELVIKNGKFFNSGDNLIYSGINGREEGTVFAKGTIRFLNVELLCSDNTPIDCRGGRIVFENCSVTTDGLSIFANMSTANHSQLRQLEFISTDVEMKNCTAANVRLVDHAGSNPINTVIKISGGNFKIKSASVDTLVRVSGSFPAEASISIEVKDAFLDVEDSVFEVIEQVSGFEPSLYISNCKMQTLPERSVHSGKVEYGEGEGLISVFDVDYYYLVGRLGCPVIYTNVTATTVFSLNFFVKAEGNNLKRITADGRTVYTNEIASYEKTVIDGEEYYIASIKDITAQNAAASQKVTVCYLDGEGKECEAEISYSVLLCFARLFEIEKQTPEALSDEAMKAVTDKLTYIYSTYEIFGDSAKGIKADKQLLNSLAEELGIV